MTVVSEPHLSPKQIAESWGMSVDYVRRRFRYEPGVLMLGRSMRVPVSVVQRVQRQSGSRAAQGPVQFARSRVRWTKSGAVERIAR